MEKSLLRTIDQKPGDGDKRFRLVQEQNDSLIIKVKTQPSDFYRVPSNSAVNFVELGSPDSASRNHPKNGQRNFHNGRPANRLSGSSDSSWSSGKKALPDLRRGEDWPVESVTPRAYKNDVIAERGSSSRNSNKDFRGETPDAEPRLFSDESSQGSPKKTQSDSKAEKHVGSGRISVRAKKRRSKNRRKKNEEQQLDLDPQTDSGLANVTRNIDEERKVRTNAECEAKTQEGAQDRVAANRARTKTPVSPANKQVPVYSSKNSDNKGAVVNNKSGGMTVVKYLDENVGVKPDLLSKSFDLDLDAPEGDQFDDEEWEDIDEEVCIDLIAGGEDEESYDENPLDISDDTLDQLVSAHVIRPRGHKVVDWAAEMESAEDDSVGSPEKQGTSGPSVPKSTASESP